MEIEKGVTKRPAVFFDRDGTLNRDVGYVTHLDIYELLPRAGGGRPKSERVGLACRFDYEPGRRGQGLFPESMLEKVHRKLQDELNGKGARLDAIYYCPHVRTETISIMRLTARCENPIRGCS